MNSILDYDTVALDDAGGALVIIDQTLLPGEIKLLHLTKQNEIWEAIKVLRVRGAPAIGVAAAIGVYLAARESTAETYGAFAREFCAAADYLNSARPTAVNLAWALRRMEQVVLGPHRCPGHPSPARPRRWRIWPDPCAAAAVLRRPSAGPRARTRRRIGPGRRG